MPLFRLSSAVSLLLLSAAPLSAAFPPLADADAFSRNGRITALQATARLRCPSCQGTAVLVGRRGDVYFLLTADHCLQGAVQGLDFFTDASYPAPAWTLDAVEVAARSPSSDLALLRVRTDRPMPAPAPICPRCLAPTGRLPALTVGCDTGKPTLQVTATTGRRPETDIQGDCWLVEAQTAHGRSGGPLIDGRGLVVGVCSRFGPNQQGVYQGLDRIYALCDEANAPWLYGSDAPSPSAWEVVVLLVKIGIGKALVTLVLRRRA